MTSASSLGVLARCSIVATEVGCVVAPEASLGLQILGFAVGGIADEHAKALYATLEIPNSLRI
jgi:hypothetical protein